MYLAVLIVTMLSPVHCEDFHLNGASFLQQADLSLGYAQWLVVSAFDTSYLQEDFLTLEEMKKSNLAKIQVKSKSTGQVCQTYWILKTHKDAMTSF